MESQKLIRTQSCLLRSSPSIRSSIHSLSDLTREDEEESHGGSKRKLSCHKTGLFRFTRSVSALVYLSTTFTLLSLVFFFENLPTCQNLLIALIFIAVTLFFASKNKTLINQIVLTIKHISQPVHTKPVQWFIGEPKPETNKIKKVSRESVECYSNGDFYEGDIHKGKCNGSGVYYYFMKGKYEGDWIQGRYDGFGIESWARGSKYKGQYKKGSRHGHGVYRFYTGDSYSGEWCNGQSHGVGVQTCADGSCYVGDFKFGVKHGLGRYHFRNGDTYTGEYFGDKMHGFGVYHFANGHCYEGAWHEGRKQGYGMYTFRNGVTKCGEWDSGHLKNPIVPPLTGSVLRAVQAARVRAENAIKQRRVDERVNKAEMAANRAATAARVAAIKAVQNQIDGTFCDIEA
ncbi:hypothetical protein AALP_AA4G089600 [Arabis alpina]|uniref:Uncharacterized protein n=1 Tax=Arabis alpina TaxID=50452 RepID=A0A087H235_ARAAL|nr:hypothetical protein AALP_AA4G089600 [Arabis alpina]